MRPVLGSGSGTFWAGRIWIQDNVSGSDSETLSDLFDFKGTGSPVD